MDGIYQILLILIKNEISRRVTLILNQCLTNGIFPDKLKIVKVVPIHKSDDDTMFNNYRPISILPTLSKVFEKVIFNQVHEHFHVNKLYFSNQYGFRKKHSTELAVLEVLYRITYQLDQGMTPINIYLDLSHTFDTLDHDILLNKLQYYGVNGSALVLFRSYLTERQHYVDYSETSSSLEHISTGIPQGSVLGPLLFIIYINDIAQSSAYFKCIYADDTTLCGTIAGQIDIENSFNGIKKRNRMAKNE